MNKDDLKHISRLEQRPEDNGNTVGWNVRMQRDNSKISKLFSDSVYGGKEKALEAAMAFRDTILEGWEESTEGLVQEPITYAKNSTGVPGIRLTQLREYKDRTADYFQFNWTDPETGKYRHKHWRIGRKGDEDYQQRYDEKLQEAEAFSDKINRKRYGKRWDRWKEQRTS